jgi:hypothetical protein
MQLTLLTVPIPAPMTAAATAFFVRLQSATTAGGLHTPGAPFGWTPGSPYRSVFIDRVTLFRLLRH